MKPLTEFTLPIIGLKMGLSEFDFSIGSSFFSQFEASPLKNGDVDVHLTLDKHSDMLVLDFEISGLVETVCDRCLAPIDLPIDDERQLIVKYSEEKVVDEDDEIVFLHPDLSDWNIAKYVYEFVILAIPMIQVIEDCETQTDPPCDFELLKRISPDDTEPTTNPFLDAFTGFQNN